MYIRDAKNREEVWLLDHIEAMNLDSRAFRSRDYVIAIDEDTGTKAGFGRIRIHTTTNGDDLCELTSIGVLEEWRGQGIGAHVIERLIEYASDQAFDTVYTLAPVPDYLTQFGFEPIDDADLPPALATRFATKRDRHDGPVVPMQIDVDSFDMPPALRGRFKQAGEQPVQRDDREAEDSRAAAEDFGIDPEEATYKYDTGGRRH